MRTSVKESVTRSTGNHIRLRTGYEWLLAGFISALLMGCASDRRLDANNEQANLRKNGAMKQPDIVRREGFLVMGRVTHRKPGTDRPEMFEAIWNDFETLQQSIKRHSVDSQYYGVSFAAGPDGSFDYMAGMAVRPVAETPEGLEVRKVPAATYAVFACPVQSIGQTYRYIFSEWRAESGCEIDNATPAFEEYPPATDTNAPVLLHIPIRARWLIDPANQKSLVNNPQS
jgi:predicted transcriptional regulator YdeE